MYITAVGQKNLSSGVEHEECESWGEFSSKVCQAWSGHPAAPAGLVVARKNRVSNWQTENKAHAHTSFVITCGAEGLGATTQGVSGGQNG